MSKRPPTVPAQPPRRSTARRPDLGERLTRLETDLKSAYVPPNELIDILDHRSRRDAVRESDPATVLGAAVSIRWLAEFLEHAAAEPWALYNPAHAAGAVDDLAAALEHLIEVFPLLAESVTRAAGRGEIPARIGEQAGTTAEAMRAAVADLRGYAHSATERAAAWRECPYRGYLVEGTPAQIRAVARELAELDPEVRVTQTQTVETDHLVVSVVFELRGTEYVVADGVGWELRYLGPAGHWQSVEFEGPSGNAVHPRWIAEQALAAVSRLPAVVDQAAAPPTD